MSVATLANQQHTLFAEMKINCNWQYDLISRQLTIWTDEEVSVYDEDAIHVLKAQLPPAEDSRYQPTYEDDETRFSEALYDEAPFDVRSSSLYAFLSSFWKKKEEGQAPEIRAIAC